MVLETKKTYENTKYKDCWMFYHDALSLMTAKECVAWMKEQYIDEEKTISYYDKWILPAHGLNDEYARFKDRPIGNSPEMMPLDNCLNKDLHECVARHVLMRLVHLLLIKTILVSFLFDLPRKQPMHTNVYGLPRVVLLLRRSASFRISTRSSLQ